jgi:ubiquinone/menaquinone biosynthesis C-methylase UbiE
MWRSRYANDAEKYESLKITRMDASITAFSDSVPEKYDRCLGPLLFEPFARDLVNRIDPDAVQDVLEIACGTGRLTRHLRVLLPPAIRLEALDLNPDMIAVANLRLSGEDVQWRVGDAQDLPYKADSFDLVICQFGIMFMPDKAKALAGFLRVLRPGGRLLFNTWNKIDTNEVIHIASETIDRFFPHEPPTFYRSPFSFYDEDLIRALVKEAGFSEIRVSLLKTTGTSPTAMEAAMGLVEGSPVIGFIMERGPKLLPAILQSVEKEIADRFGERPMQSPLEAWVVSGRKK